MELPLTVEVGCERLTGGIRFRSGLFGAVVLQVETVKDYRFGVVLALDKAPWLRARGWRDATLTDLSEPGLRWLTAPRLRVAGFEEGQS